MNPSTTTFVVEVAPFVASVREISFVSLRMADLPPHSMVSFSFRYDCGVSNVLETVLVILLEANSLEDPYQFQVSGLLWTSFQN